MEISDFSRDSLWAIDPARFAQMERTMLSLYQSGELEKKAAAWSGRQPAKIELDIRDGVAVLPISGPISKRETFFSWLFGGTAIDKLTEQLQAAMDDPAVKAIVLAVDSPGGTIGGLEQFAAMVRDAGQVKPVVSMADGMMASAAYWIGSAAAKIITDNTADVGSIGVLMVHTDYSEMDKKYGINRTYLTAGKYKAMGNNAEPLSQESRQVLQAELDYLYDIFVGAVAINRGTDKKTVLNHMADGRIFIGKQAVDAGLADEVGTLATAITTASDLALTAGAYKQRNAGGKHAPGKEVIMTEQTKVTPETTEQLAAMYPALATALREEGAKTVDTAKIRTESAMAESDRILGLVEIQFGKEASETFRKVVASGVTVEQFEAIRAASPAPAAGQDADAKAKILAALQKSGAENPGSGSSGAGGGTEQDFQTLVTAYRFEHKCSKTEAIQAIMKSNPEAHKQYIAKAQAN